MAILHDKPVYVFDQQNGKWYKWDPSVNNFVESEVPTLTKNFAGIGTRELSEAGKQAIRDTYEKTFGKKQSSPQQPIEIWYGSNDNDPNRSNPDLSNLAYRPFSTTLNGALDTPIEVKSVEHAFQLAKLYEMYDELDEDVFN
jgi:hypothetical protein